MRMLKDKKVIIIVLLITFNIINLNFNRNNLGDTLDNSNDNRNLEKDPSKLDLAAYNNNLIQ